jgi:uncharacterized membrane protein YqjE
MTGPTMRETGLHSEKGASMAETGARRPARMAQTSPHDATAYESPAPDSSLGDLVALAVSDVSQLVKCEVDLAKLELKEDARRLGIGGVLLAMAAFVGCLVLMLLCFAFAYGLMALGIWGWASFLIVAGTCILLALGAVLIGITRFRRMSGLRKTRSTVSDDLALIRRDDTASPAGSARSA